MTSYSEFFDTQVENPILQKFKMNFSSKCEEMSSTTNTFLSQNTTLTIPFDSVIIGCDIVTGQNLNTRIGQYCLDIPKLLAGLTEIQRQNLINSIVSDLKGELLQKYSNKVRFINALCDKLKNELNIINYVGPINDVIKGKETVFTKITSLSDMLSNKYPDTQERLRIINEQNPLPPDLGTSIINSIRNYRTERDKFLRDSKTLQESKYDIQLYNKVLQSCSQQIIVEQNQNIILKGRFECKNGGSVNIIKNLAVDSQSECFVKPVLQKVKNDAFLQRLYIQGDNVGCKFYLEYGLCSNNQRKIITKILSGNCSNINTEEIVPCDNPKCNISNWSDWSVCNFTNGKATRFRTRKFIKQGEDCNNVMKEVEECNIPDRYAGNDLINKNALKYDLYDTYRGILDKNTYILLFLLLTILVLFITIL